MIIILLLTLKMNYNIIKNIISQKLIKNNKIDIILIQGASCAGKSVFCNYLYKHLKQVKRIIKISTDNYYRSPGFDYKDPKVKLYNFDNPCAIDWDSLSRTLEGYANREPQIIGSTYDFFTKIRKDIIIPNIYPDIILIDGIYAFNLFNKNMFNITRLDPYKDIESHDTNVYTDNDHNFLTKFNVLKIQLKISKEYAKKIRIERDIKKRFKNCSPEFIDMLEHKFEKTIWPATEKWIYSPYNISDINIPLGTMNLELCYLVWNTLFEFYEFNKTKQDFLTIIHELEQECD